MMQRIGSRFWVLAAAALLLSACNGKPYWQKPVEVVPTQPAPKVVLDINVDTLEINVVEPAGARPCSLCTKELSEKYGPTCEKAPEAGIAICAGLANATVQNFGQIFLARSHKNPYCVTIGSQNIGGTSVATQLCFCQPSDAPKCPPPTAWYQ